MATKFKQITLSILLANNALAKYLNNADLKVGKNGGTFVGNHEIANKDFSAFGIVLPKGGMILPQHEIAEVKKNLWLMENQPIVKKVLSSSEDMPPSAYIAEEAKKRNIKIGRNTYLDNGLPHGGGYSIGERCYIGTLVSIGEGAVIGDRCIILQGFVAPGAHVPDDTFLCRGENFSPKKEVNRGGECPGKRAVSFSTQQWCNSPC